MSFHGLFSVVPPVGTAVSSLLRAPSDPVRDLRRSTRRRFAALRVSLSFESDPAARVVDRRGWTICSAVTYEELRRLASSVRSSDDAASLSQTALVNEAWLKLANSPAFRSVPVFSEAWCSARLAPRGREPPPADLRASAESTSLGSIHERSPGKSHGCRCRRQLELPARDVLSTTKSATASDMTLTWTTVPSGMFSASIATVTGPD